MVVESDKSVPLYSPTANGAPTKVQISDPVGVSNVIPEPTVYVSVPIAIVYPVSKFGIPDHVIIADVPSSILILVKKPCLKSIVAELLICYFF